MQRYGSLFEVELNIIDFLPLIVLIKFNLNKDLVDLFLTSKLNILYRIFTDNYKVYSF